jgi:hypothetical protein
MLFFIKRVVSKRFEWCWKRENVSCKKSGTKRSLFRLRLILFHAMFDVILIVCLVIFSVAWLVSNDRDCFMSLWKNHVLFFYYVEAFIWFSPLMLYLGWLGACLQHVWLLPSLHKPPWSFSFWFLMPFYAFLMMFCRFAWLWPFLLSYLVAPSLLLALILYWVWALLVHPTQKTKLCQCVHHTYLLAICYSKVHSTCFYLSFKLNSFWCYVKISQ